MALYVVQNTTGTTLKKGHNFMVVEADDAANAAAFASAYFDGDASWANATATLFSSATDLSPITDGDGNTQAYSLYAVITGPDTSASFEVSAAAADTVDDLGDAMVIALNAHADIANAAYATPSLTLADVADGIGDHTVVCELRLGGVALPGFVGAIVHEGIAAAVLTAALVPGEGVPSVLLTAKV
jgi:hypothetical protein